MRRRSGWPLPLALALLLALPAAAADPSGLEIMQTHRRLHRVRDEQERQLVRLVSAGGAVKERRVARYTLSGPGDLDKILVRFLAPRDVENTALLTWEARDGDDDQWLYLPATKRPRRIAASGKKNRFMGTDFTYEDLRPENLEVNRYRLAGRERVGDHECFVVEAVPATPRQAADTAYSRRRLWLRTDNHAVVKREYDDRQGRLQKVETLRRLVQVTPTAWRPDEFEMHDVQQGTRTVVTVESRAVNGGLREDFFTEAELVRGGS
jgi:hypothetical protein